MGDPAEKLVGPRLLVQDVVQPDLESAASFPGAAEQKASTPRKGAPLADIQKTSAPLRRRLRRSSAIWRRGGGGGGGERHQCNKNTSVLKMKLNKLVSTLADLLAEHSDSNNQFYKTI